MKAFAATLLIFVSVLSIRFANGASTPGRPPGVDAQNWIPVSEKMGFVVTTPHLYPGPGGDNQILLLTPPAEGYFMVRNGSRWKLSVCCGCGEIPLGVIALDEDDLCGFALLVPK